MTAEHSTHSTLDLALERARPAHDDLALELARSRLGPVFDVPSQPVRLGRFVLLDRLGAGGMGTVYSAYDPQLDRRVALKLLLARTTGEDDASHRQLLREARTLARLSHPNVVPIHDVGVIDGMIFLVMELVAGQTLRAWLASEVRSYRDVLAVYGQAGRGLAAAHDVGIVHRDFKPDNALIGDDGRVRVVDFGLARGSPGTDALASGPGRATHADASMPDAGAWPTRSASTSGGAAGTPAYMAPEQLGRARVGPAADQFAFCVALYEGLHGRRPFAAGTLAERVDSIQARKRPELPGDRRVPRWIHDAVCRGLAADPADRHPSMNALLAALSRDPARTRMPWLVLAVFVALAGLLVYTLRRDPVVAVEPCQGGSEVVARVWHPARRAEVESALRGTLRPYASSVVPRVLVRLDDYAAAWASMHHAACMSHQRGEQSAELLDQRMRCLDGRLRRLDSAITVIAEIDASALANATQVAGNLPSLAYCADSEALAAEVPPPANDAMAERVSDLRALLARARALEDAGRFPDATDLARTVARDAETLGYGPLLAEALLGQGRAAMNIASARFEGAALPLRRAGEIAIAHHMWEPAVEALARRIYVERIEARNQAESDAVIPIAEALAQLIAGHGLARPLLLNNIGVTYMTRADRAHARTFFERALAEVERDPDPPLELSCVRKNVAMLTPDPGRRARLMQTELDRLEQALGKDHPRALEHRVAYAHYTADPAAARALLEPACRLYEELHPDQLHVAVKCLYYLGFLTAELGDRTAAAAILDRVAALDPSGSMVDERVWFHLARSHAAYYRGEPRTALDALRAAHAGLPDRPVTWWDKQRIGHARLSMGLAEQALGRNAAAITDLEAAIAVFEEQGQVNEDVENHQRLALAEVALARALGGPRASQRARTLQARAAAWYTEVGGGYAELARQLDGQLASLAPISSLDSAKSPITDKEAR